MWVPCKANLEVFFCIQGRYGCRESSIGYFSLLLSGTVWSRVFQTYFCKAAQPVLCARSRSSWIKIKISGIPNCLNYFVHSYGTYVYIYICIQLKNVSAGNIIQPCGPRATHGPPFENSGLHRNGKGVKVRVSLVWGGRGIHREGGGKTYESLLATYPSCSCSRGNIFNSQKIT
jgi:hypothetical protein